MKFISLVSLFLMIISCKEPQAEQKPVKEVVAADTIVPVAEDNNHGPEGRTLVFETKHTFDSFKTEAYTGTPAAPDFTGNPYAKDPEYVAFITKGCKEGINFAGKYTLIHKGCGAMCEHVFIVDRSTGKIFTNTKIKDGKYGYMYKKDSSLLIANSEAFQDETLTVYNNLYATPEFYVWEGSGFKFLQ